MATKTLTVLGERAAGKKTLVGRLIYSCGLTMTQLEQLQSNGVDDYVSLVAFFEEKDIEASFFAPSARFIVQQTQEPDVAIWLIDASQQTSWDASLEELKSLLSDKQLQPKDKLLILANKMDLVDWSPVVLNDIEKKVADATIQSSLIPISALKGDNILATSKLVTTSNPQHGNASPVSQQTLMQLLA
ncbi:HR1 repeat Rho-binding protein [Colletotrichum abscissum]|uniref:HR1 repeat Rho-binding protein n=1 Tax=Colletotrichum limetticola TaxID=1209924 RepID=A0ABQ9P6Z6_9PEZI|nr:HR1 repeat Rho-binding protein [Colletotrichum limetticola]